MKQKILILGKGYIGNAIARYLDPDIRKILHISKAELDYTNPTTLKLFLEAGRFDYVINCAGYTGKPNVDAAEDNKELCWKLNVVDSVQINRACRDVQANYIHIGSGCIYNDIVDATEEDVPNFGLYNSESSFYSKSKHAYETLVGDYGLTLRIRMPFDDTLSSKNYLYKLWTYPKLIGYNTFNSKTSISDICRFIAHILYEEVDVRNIGLLNFVNPNPRSTSSIVEDLMEDVHWPRAEYEWVDEQSLNLKAKRSNCCLSSEKRKTLFPNFHMPVEADAITKCLSEMRDL